MTTLDGKLDYDGSPNLVEVLVKITKNKNLPKSMRSGMAWISHDSESGEFQYQIYFKNKPTTNLTKAHDNVYVYLSNEFDYLNDGDIVKLDFKNKRINTLFRVNSEHNTLLLTERCNHFCLMCSQPPKNKDDSWLLKDAFDLISLIPESTKNIGFSGGEPTLYGDELIRLVLHTKTQLPNTSIDLLSNGRAFSDPEYAKKFADVNHPSCCIAIPIYSDDATLHDFVVQSDGAFDETVKGILNLKSLGQIVEVRIVLQKQTLKRLVELCEFIAKNLIFVDHVALMGLEMMGFTRANLDQLWVDPYDYKDNLSEAVSILNSYGVKNSVYNHQLCVINKDVEANYAKSISDWKNEYVKECDGCTRKSECGGFFSSNVKYRYSEKINPFK
jgi:His-Xaa-Ser system radical SAM maturase HxsC